MAFIKCGEGYINSRYTKQITLEFSQIIKNGYDIIVYMKGEKRPLIISSHNNLDEARDSLKSIMETRSKKKKWRMNNVERI